MAASVAVAPKAGFYATMWGVMDLPKDLDIKKLEAQLARIKSLGYDGIEAPVAFAMSFGTGAFKAALEAAGLRYIPMVFSSGPPTPAGMGVGDKSEAGITHPGDNTGDYHDVSRHKAVWEAQVREAMALGPVVVEITSHTGKDFFTAAEADDMLAFCLAFESEHGVRVNHETHRNRILYSPWIMVDILARHPTLKLCADYSHFCVVAEAEPGEPELEKVIAAISPAVRHVHARTGFAEGPQVPDVRGKSYKATYEGHKRWWMAIFDALASAGKEAFVTITPEHGPVPYQWTHPADDSLLTRVWDVNHFTGLELQELYAAKYGAAASGSLKPDPTYTPLAAPGGGAAATA